MRRFVAYLSLAIAGIATIGATFNAAMVDSHSNIEYSDGTEMVFQITDKEGKEEAVEAGASAEIADMMQKRLEIYGESRYDVVTMGDDMVKVVLSEDGQYLDEIKTYLSFNGEFALGTNKKAVAVGEEFLLPDAKAYIKNINHYPTVVIPVNSESEEFKNVITEAEELAKEAAENKDEENPDAEETATYLYLAYNFDVKKDTISDIVEGKNEYQKNKLLKMFDFKDLWFNEDKTEIKTIVDIADQEGNVSFNTIEKATHTANHIVNLINSDPLNYTVSCIYQSTAPAYFEEIVGVNQVVAWSRTLTATLFAILILSLLLAVFYRWGAVAIGSLSVASTYLGLVLALVFTVEFNTAAVIGLCAVALASIASGIVYMTKVKEECYRGRTLKKANAEGAKRALLPIVDINLVLIIMGACIYWLGGLTMASFAAVTVFGGIFSLIFNTLLLKGMMWLLTNTTKFQGNYTVIGVENNRVPNILNEETQTYYGPYQESNPQKHKKVFGIVSAVLFVASLVGTITFGALNGGVIFNDSEVSKEYSYFTVQTSEKQSTLNITTIDNLFTYAEYVDGADAENEEAWENAKQFDYTLSKPELADIETIYDEDGNPIERYYVVMQFSSEINENTYFRLYENEDKATISYKGTLTEVFESIKENRDSDAIIAFRTGELVSAQQPNYAKIIGAVAVGIAFIALYLILRYGLARGIVTLMATTLVGFVTVGIFTLTRVAVPMNLFIALPVVMIVTLILSIMLINKNKEMIADDKVKNKEKTAEHRKELSLKSNALALGPILVFTAIGVYLMINFFGFGVAATSSIYMFAFIGVVLAAVVVAILYAPTVDLIYLLFDKLNIKKPDFKKPHKKNKKKVVKAKSSEPEEAIFIGIND